MASIDSDMAETLPALLTALGELTPEKVEPPTPVEAEPIEELRLKLTDPVIKEKDGTRRVAANAELLYHPAVRSKRYRFTAPLDTIETDELRWYLERFYFWPRGVFRERAERVEKLLHDSKGFLFAGGRPARVRRRLVSEGFEPPPPTGLPCCWKGWGAPRAEAVRVPHKVWRSTDPGSPRSTPT